MAPISNVTSVSRSPQVVVIAVYKEWLTYVNLLAATGFTISVPHASQNDPVWKLGEKYSGFKPPAGQKKLDACGVPIIYDVSTLGPVLADAIGWLECKVIGRGEIESDHGIFFGGVARAHFNEKYLSPNGDHFASTKPLMQVVGNVFATSGDNWINDYF